MNWYKISQQQDFGFLETLPQEQPKSIEESQEYKTLEKRSHEMFQELLKNVHGRNDIIKMLKMYGLKWKRIRLNNKDAFIVVLGSEIYVIDNIYNPVLKSASEYNISSYNV